MTVQKIKKQHILKELRSYSDVQEILPQNLAVFEFLYSRAQSIWHQKTLISIFVVKFLAHYCTNAIPFKYAVFRIFCIVVRNEFSTKNNLFSAKFLW